jgi:hypothetical protein
MVELSAGEAEGVRDGHFAGQQRVGLTGGTFG